MHPDWVRDLRDRCAASGTPFFFKQWGEYRGFDRHQLAESFELAATSGRPHREVRTGGGDFDFAAVRLGKHAAGRELDGRTWDEMPERAA